MMTFNLVTKRALRWALAGSAPLLGGAVACFPERQDFISGACELVPNTMLDCRAEGYEGELLRAGLVGYACTGEARPDHDAVMLEGVPTGLLCADKPDLADGRRAYCCTEDPVTCAYDPTMECDPGDSGYECYGNNRPESLNPSLLCSNGTNERGLYRYCCTGQPEPSPCKESMAAECDTRLLGFLCEGDRRPRGEDYGPNRSRADYYYPVCDIATVAPNPAFKAYCCYMTLTIPVGGTCVQHPYVPGCESGRFGFSCYGPDTPEDNYPPMKCPDAGVPGTSAEGYAAKLYCCDFT
ncbi:MAG TPA: hypothetical protein VFZ53_25145 [Polyangiaceae bacterium]